MSLEDWKSEGKKRGVDVYIQTRSAPPFEEAFVSISKNYKELTIGTFDPSIKHIINNITTIHFTYSIKDVLLKLEPTIIFMFNNGRAACCADAIFKIIHNQSESYHIVLKLEKQVEELETEMMCLYQKLETKEEIILEKEEKIVLSQTLNHALIERIEKIKDKIVKTTESTLTPEEMEIMCRRAKEGAIKQREARERLAKMYEESIETHMIIDMSQAM